MANKFSDREDFDIPASLIDEHEWVSDALIDGELGTNCTLVYPPSINECPNCLFDPSTGKSANLYKTGGPIPFEEHTLCPWCGGEGRESKPIEDSIRMRVYWGGMEVQAAMRQFSKFGTSDIKAVDGLLFVIGYMVDLPKFERADSLIIVSNTRQHIRCERFSETVPWGFRKNRYFAAMLKRG